MEAIDQIELSNQIARSYIWRQMEADIWSGGMERDANPAGGVTNSPNNFF